jgi:ankyrin repeat protein
MWQEMDDLRTALSLAFLGAKKELLQLIDAGRVDVNTVDTTRRSLLHIAAREGHDQLVSELVRRGANVNARDFIHYTPLFYAIENDHVSIAHQLIEMGSDLITRACLRETPHSIAQKRMNAEMAKRLPFLFIEIEKEPDDIEWDKLL